MNPSDCNPAGHFPRRHTAAKIRRVLSATFCFAFAAALGAADDGPGYRIGVLKGGVLSVKENALDAPWTVAAENVSSFAIEGNRIGIRRRDGGVLVKEGGLGAPWVRLAERTQNFALGGDRVAIITRRGSLMVKEGSLNAGWVRIAERTRSFQLHGNRIGVLMLGGALQIQEGKLDSSLIHVTDEVQSFQLSGQRLGVLYKNGLFDVMEGGINSDFVRQAKGVQSFYLEGDRIGVLRNGVLEVKEGGLSDAWVREADGVSSFKLSGDRIGVVQSGVLNVKSGGLHAPWTREEEGVTQFQLHGNRIIFQRQNDALLAKEGNLDAAWVSLARGVQKFQFARTGMNTTQPGNPTGGSGDWQMDAARGEITKNILLESPSQRINGQQKQVEVRFPDGYTYCRHAVSNNQRNGIGGVSVVTAESDRLVFGVWTGRRADGSDPGGVQMTAKVTGISDSIQDDSACSALPETGGGCGNVSCPRYLDAAESDNGQCMPTSCDGGRVERVEEQVCVYNLRPDEQTQSRARLLACRNRLYNYDPASAER